MRVAFLAWDSELRGAPEHLLLLRLVCAGCNQDHDEEEEGEEHGLSTVQYSTLQVTVKYSTELAMVPGHMDHDEEE